jgi:hypothetical protein
MQSANNAVETIRNSIPNTQQISNGLGNAVTAVSSGVDAAKESINSTLNSFSSQNAVNAGKEFLESNSIIAKFVFLLLVVIAFMLVVSLGMKLIAYFTQPSRTPYLVKGKVSGTANLTISQTPATNTDPIVFRSNNQRGGMEFTWSVWLQINSLPTKFSSAGGGTDYVTTSYNHIFSKGNATFNTDAGSAGATNDRYGVATVNNAPGVYLQDKTSSNGSATLRVYMDTVNNNNIHTDISNIPMLKWFHMAIRVRNNIMDIYINGNVAQRYMFTEVPKQNYNDVLVGANGGFSGSLSNLLYYDRALNIYEINNIILAGPNTKENPANVPVSNLGYYGYLSRAWYSN